MANLTILVTEANDKSEREVFVVKYNGEDTLIDIADISRLECELNKLVDVYPCPIDNLALVNWGLKEVGWDFFEWLRKVSKKMDLKKLTLEFFSSDYPYGEIFKLFPNLEKVIVLDDVLVGKDYSVILNSKIRKLILRIPADNLNGAKCLREFLEKNSNPIENLEVDFSSPPNNSNDSNDSVESLPSFGAFSLKTEINNLDELKSEYFKFYRRANLQNLFVGVKANNSIKQLSISYDYHVGEKTNPLEQNNFALFIELMKKPYRKLAFKNMVFGSDARKLLFERLEKNTTLESFILSAAFEEKRDEEIFECLFNSLAKEKKLKQLVLQSFYNDPCTEAFCKKIRGLISLLPDLEVLIMDDFFCTLGSEKHFTDLLTTNPKLGKVYIDGNDIIKPEEEKPSDKNKLESQSDEQTAHPKYIQRFPVYRNPRHK